MLRHLVDLAERLDEKSELIPRGFREESAEISWVIEIGEKHGRLREASISVPRPYRDRSVNIAPKLLADYAYYVLGIAEEGKEDRAEKAHKAFLDLLRDAAEVIDDPDLKSCHHVLSEEGVTGDLMQEVGPKDVVAMASEDGEFLFARKAVKKYWARYVAEEAYADETGNCAICCENDQLLRLLPEDVSLLGQTPKLVSFNKPAFRSYGKTQTLNASICHPCGSRAVQALNYLTGSSLHRVQLARNPRDGASASLEDHLAVFWTEAEEVETEDGEHVDPRAVLSATAGGFGTDEATTEKEVEDLLKVPWHARTAAFRAREPGVHLLVLSPNKARLVVREWLHESLDGLRRNLRKFVEATRVESPSGYPGRPFGVGELLEAAAARGVDPESGREIPGSVEANEVRGLLRAAYSGAPVPASLRGSALRALRKPAHWNAAPWLTQRLISVLKLTQVLNLTGEESVMEEAERLERLDTEQLDPGYLCGRLLAVLEDAQRWAADGQLNTTLVDRNYTAAATAPASALPRLLNQAETAHIPKIRRKSGGGSAEWLRGQIEGIVAGIGPDSGFPRTLNNEGQGRFALGFYHQRAEIRRRKRQHAEEQTTSEEEE